MSAKYRLPDLNKPPIKGMVFIDVCSGVAGPHISIGDHESATRIAGPKAWGGGSTMYRFPVDIKELRRALAEYGTRGKARGERHED